MSLFKNEIEKIAVVREKKIKQQQEDEAFEEFKQMSFLETEKLRKKDFDTWCNFSKREQSETDE